MSVVALIPAFNEADRVAATVAGTRAVTGIDRIIVIDDGSTDETVQSALAAGAEVVELAANLGKGAALDAGYSYASTDEPVETLLLLDADLGDTARQASLLLEPVASGRADMSIAAFPRPTGKAGFGLVMGLARWGIHRLGDTSFNAQAPLSGQRALNARALSACTPFAGGYGVEVALTVRALRANLTLLEVPTTMAHAATGRDAAGFAHRGRQFAHVARALLSLALEKRRNDT